MKSNLRNVFVNKNVSNSLSAALLHFVTDYPSEERKKEDIMKAIMALLVFTLAALRRELCACSLKI